MDSSEAERRSLVVYFNGTFVGRQNGAHVRVWDLVTWLSQAFGEVTLFSYSDHPEYPWRPCDVAEFKAQFPTVGLVLDRQPWSLRLARRLKNAAMTLTPRLGARLLRWRVRGATPGYERIFQSGNHLLVVNYVDALSELNGIVPGDCLVESHDIKFMTHMKRSNASIADLRTLGKLRSELCMLQQCSGIIAIAPQETSLFRLLYLDKPVWYVPQYPVGRKSAPLRDQVDFDILFVGSDNVFNVEGVVAFLTRCSWASRYRIAIAGGVCDVKEVQRRAASHENVELLGFVEDLAAIYARTKVVISPVDGTGLKIKAIEALAAGKPVLASAHTISGLPPGFDGCVFPLTAEATHRLVTDPDGLAAASRSAVRYAAGLADAGDAAQLRAYINQRLGAGGTTEVTVDDMRTRKKVRLGAD